MGKQMRKINFDEEADADREASERRDGRSEDNGSAG
jgi:hypothetical protein